MIVFGERDGNSILDCYVTDLTQQQESRHKHQEHSFSLQTVDSEKDIASSWAPWLHRCCIIIGFRV